MKKSSKFDTILGIFWGVLGITLAIGLFWKYCDEMQTYAYTRSYTVNYTTDYVGKNSNTDGAIRKVDDEIDLMVTEMNKLTMSGNSSAATIDNVSPANGDLLYYNSDTGNYENEFQTPMTNLLINSGFGFWSNSTLAQGTTGRQTDFNVSNIHTDDCADDDTADYTLTDCTLTFNASGNYTVTSTAATQMVTYAPSTLVVGKLYKFVLDVMNGNYTLTSTDDFLRVTDNAGTTTLAETPLATEAAPDDYSVIWEATETNNKVNLVLAMGPGSNTMNIDNWYIDEVTPGCIAADALACDGWAKDATLDIFREHNGSNTKDGSFYSLKMSPTLQNDYIQFPNNSIHDDAEWYQRFAGRTVAFGVWAKTSTASDVVFNIQDGITNTASSYHTGGGSWEWLETTKTVSGTPSSFRIRIFTANASPGTAYVSQPILVFGKHIGQGNYTYNPQESVYLEAPKLSHFMNAVRTHDDTTNREIYPQADSSGALPRCIIIDLYFAGKNSQATNKWQTLMTSASGNPSSSILTNADTSFVGDNARIKTSATGTFYGTIVDDGNDTIVLKTVYISATQQ